MFRKELFRSRGLSLGTKLILITVLLETLTIGIGLYSASNFLSGQRLQRFQQILFSQSDLIAKEVTIEKDLAPHFGISKLELNPLVVFQIIDLDGRILYDSKEPSRINAQILGHHILFNIARKSALKRGSTEYTLPETNEHFIGTYRRVLDRYLILGAILKDDIVYDIQLTVIRFLFFALLLCGLSVISIVIFTHHIIGPIRSLTFAAKRIAEGNFDIEISPTSRDEIGELSDSFITMTKRIQMLLDGEVKKNRMEKEVGIAVELQHHFLPANEIKNDRYEIQSFYQSASETGGDYWGYLETENHFLIYVGDATGHGLPSAMLTATARGCFSALQHFYRTNPGMVPTPSLFLEYANQAVLDISLGELQMTMFVAVYSFQNKTLSFSNAGHNPAWVIRNWQTEPTIETLLSRGPRLGESKDFRAGVDQSVTLTQDDLLFLYTDGLIESKNEDGVNLGKTKVKEVFSHPRLKPTSVDEVKMVLTSLIKEHHSDQLPEDDVTFSLVRFS